MNGSPQMPENDHFMSQTVEMKTPTVGLLEIY